MLCPGRFILVESVIFEFCIRSGSQARFIFSLVCHSIGREFFVRFSEIDGNLYRNSEKAVTQPPQGHTKIVKNKMVLIRPYLVTHSKPLPNIFWVGAGRQVFSVASSAESTRVACWYISISTILLSTIFGRKQRLYNKDVHRKKSIPKPHGTSRPLADDAVESLLVQPTDIPF